MIDQVAEDENIFSFNWDREPVPSRDTPKDRKRVQALLEECMPCARCVVTSVGNDEYIQMLKRRSTT